ncbi:efflux RND transporter permease subunit [Actinokineospora sp. UTMC 2448]|uniref:MMPL family transporter n=1 Tax=Actinokineospora sp. UTMC 2448 TaxID=2268449 RepID=UPI0021640251|nr:MMPL family transporter [Actinokineospora sp. UTMC 2448]UVS82689.1 Membrane protein YdfJ [Actinokineospora sp. UTMC 2448]
MFARWGALVHRRRWVVLVAVLVVTVTGGLWGLGVFDKLTQGGYEDPGSQSAQVSRIMQDALGQRPADVVVVYTAPAGRTVDDPDMAARVTQALNGLPPERVAQRVDYWSTQAPTLISGDRTLALATITLTGEDYDSRQANYQAIADQLTVEGIETRVGGQAPTEQAMTDRSNADLVIAEAISLPVTLVLLLFIFGSAVAAALPVLVGGLSIFGALGVLRALSLGLEVNNFAVNVATLLGLGMAIDYGLFIVGRFREELAGGAEPREAVRRTVATAGRTVAFSATLLVIALSGLLVFPMDFLKSMAYGGMSAVAIAAIVSLTLLPALLAILGRNVDRLAVRRAPTGEPRWLGRVADAVMRRPVWFAAPIIAVLVVLALPFGEVRFGGYDVKQLPPGDPNRVTAEVIADNFPGAGDNTAEIVLRGADQADAAAFVAAGKQVPGVLDVVPTGANGDVFAFSAPLAGESSSDEARDAVDGLRAVASDAEVLVGGFPAMVADSVDAIVAQVPWMIAILVGATLVLMFLAFGSILLPVKAVVMSALSLSATFGVLVFVFQQGHFADALGVTPQPAQAGMMVLIGAVVFGLSTDYETFLLSRMVEARAHGMSTPDAVRTGLVRTGRMITAAALLLGVVTGAFAMSSLASMRFIGTGMIVALLLDATVVRMLLVPAVLRLLGDASWWAPRGLRRLQERAGLSEVEAPRELERV